MSDVRTEKKRTAGGERGGGRLPRGRDDVFMRRAFELAELGRGATSPNPVVGAVIVLDGEVVGEGYHECCGGPHAEVNALAEAGPRARGATLYVTLEPCSVSGKTPPCTDAIIESGLARTVVPSKDPNPQVAGRGIELLTQAGVDVDLGLMREEGLSLNAPYFKYRRTGLPLTTLKLAVSLDGHIAPPPGGPRWTSSSASREFVHAMRAKTDCVMVGVGTVLADDPRLTDRRPPEARRTRLGVNEVAVRQPARLVLDSTLRIPIDSALVAGAGGTRTIVACSNDADPSRRAALEHAGVRVWTVPVDAAGVDLEAVLKRAADEGLLSVLSEGGSTVANSLMASGLVDRVAFFVAPRLYGPGGTPALSGRDGVPWGGETQFANASWTEIGGDCLFEADVVPREGSE